MRNGIIIVLTVMFSTSGLFMVSECLGRDKPGNRMGVAKELPGSFPLFSSDENTILPFFVKDSSLWPDEMFIKEKKMKISLPEVKASIDPTLYWLSKIIQGQWLPEDIEQRLLPLQESLEGNDAIWTRYQINDYAIQIVTDYGLVRLFIRPMEKKSVVSVKNKKEMNAFIIKAVETFLQKSNIIKQKLTEAQESQGVALGMPLINSSPNLWWEQVRWWSDGCAIAFWIPKTDERTSIVQPVRKKHWFSRP